VARTVAPLMKAPEGSETLPRMPASWAASRAGGQIESSRVRTIVVSADRSLFSITYSLIACLRGLRV